MFCFFFNEVIPEAHLLPSPLITLAQETQETHTQQDVIPGFGTVSFGLMLSVKETSTVTYFFN